MKLQTLLIASAAILTIACEKDDFYSGVEDSSKARIITASFENSETKTTLAEDGKTPLWKAGDKIWISDGESSATITISDISPNERSFTFSLPTKITGDILYAVYPASCATGAAGENGIGITIPSRQDGTFASANICVAMTSEGKKDVLSFKNATAIIKVTDNKTAHDYMFLEASAEIAPAIAGSFTAAINDNTVSLTNPTNAKSKIGGTLLTGENAISYYAIAPCQATSLTFKARSATEGATKGKFASKTFSSDFTFNANTIYQLAMPSWIANQYTERIIIGEFSVANGKKVEFSPGNLWSDGASTPTLCFEDNQWTTLTSWNSSHVSHFYWTDDVSKADDEKYTSYLGNDFFAKEGNSLTVGGQSGWYALTYGEWNYLINIRMINGGTSSGYNKTCVWKGGDNAVNGVNGLVIFPDDYKGSTDPTTEWSVFESAGCVFLPVAGLRNDSTVQSFITRGYYWSSTPFETSEKVGEAGYLRFYSGNAFVGDNFRNNGFSVRLVRE